MGSVRFGGMYFDFGVRSLGATSAFGIHDFRSCLGKMAALPFRCDSDLYSSTIVTVFGWGSRQRLSSR